MQRYDILLVDVAIVDLFHHSFKGKLTIRLASSKPFSDVSCSCCVKTVWAFLTPHLCTSCFLHGQTHADVLNVGVFIFIQVLIGELISLNHHIYMLISKSDSLGLECKGSLRETFHLGCRLSAPKFNPGYFMSKVLDSHRQKSILPL